MGISSRSEQNAINDSIYHNLTKTAQQTTGMKLNKAKQQWYFIRHDLCKIKNLGQISEKHHDLEANREKSSEEYDDGKKTLHSELTKQTHDPFIQYKIEHMDPIRERVKQLEVEVQNLENQGESQKLTELKGKLNELTEKRDNMLV